MYIVKSSENYLDKLVEVFEEYREFCGFESIPKDTKAFLQKLICNEESVMFIAIEAETDKVMGFVNLYPSYSSLALQRLWILNDLGVSSHFRGTGVSKALIKKVKQFAKETNAVRIELKTERTNVKAISLYQSMNFAIDNDNVYYRVPV